MKVFIGGIKATNKEKRTKLSKLSPNDIFKLPNSKDGKEYYYYGRVKIMNRFNEVKEYGPYMYASTELDSKDIYTDEDLNVILIKEFVDSNKRKRKK